MTEPRQGRGGRKGRGPPGGRGGRFQQGQRDGRENTDNATDNSSPNNGAPNNNESSKEQGQRNGGSWRDDGRRGGGRGRGRGSAGRQNNDKQVDTKQNHEDDNPGSNPNKANNKGIKGNKGKKTNNQQRQKNEKSAQNDQANNENKNEKSSQNKDPKQNEPKKKNTENKKNAPKKKNENKTGEAKSNNTKQNIPKTSDGSKKGNINDSDGQQSSPYALPIPPNKNQQTNDINYKMGEPITVLHVAEKPSIAQAIAKGLSGGSCSSGGGRGMPMYEFTNPAFPKAPHASRCNHRVTSVAGHVFSVDFHAKYQSWESCDPAELFTAPIVKKATSMGVIKNLEAGARGANFIVLWMDCDREGENINFEVLDCCMHLMQSGGTSSNFDRVYRAYFSAINPSDILKAYKVLGKPDKNQALSVDARQEIDLKVGIAFSRFQTRYFQGRYGDLNSAVLSYGPCQTPTLQFCVKRQIDIETFSPEPYWALELNVFKRGRMLQALWNSGRSFNKGKVEKLLAEAAANNGIVKVSNTVTKEKKQGRPVPLNTVALLKACSKGLGIGPHHAMQIAERLYLSGYLSYPRTESTAYPQSFDIRETLQEQSTDGRWGKYCRNLLKDGVTKSKGGVDMGDHPPITPCSAAGIHELSGDMARVYDLVVRHFIASVSEDAVWLSTLVEFEVDALADKGKFSLRGKKLVSPGFLAIVLSREYGEDTERQVDVEDEDERTIPEFTIGDIIPLAGSKAESNTSNISVASAEPARATLLMREKETTPPTLLTESELITLMEKHGIGTDASIPSHIENIQKRNYCELVPGRRLKPSKLGLVLVNGYHAIDSTLVLPQIRSDIEDECTKISKGIATREQVVEKAIELFSGKFDFFVKNIHKMDVLFGSSFSKLEDIGKLFTRCGLSRRYLQYIPGPPPRLYNKYTETVYPLPVGGIVKQWTGRTCPVEGCGFELCLYSVGQPQRTFPLCPYCFNHPDWALESDEFPEDQVEREDKSKEKQIKTVAGQTLTLECPLPDKHPLIDDLTVSPDPDSAGVLMLDPHMGPKWRLVATRAPTIVYFPQSVETVTVLDKKDEVLGCHLMRVKFKDGEVPPGAEAKYESVFPMDAILQNLVRVFHGSDRLKATPRGGRGRGRGRGGRGGRSGRNES